MFIIIKLFTPTSKRDTIEKMFLVLLLIFYLFGTSSFIYENARFLDTYGHFTNAKVITTTHQISGGNSYMNRHPGSFIFFGIFKMVTAMNDISIMKYYPIFLMIVLSFGIYVITRKMTHNNISFIAPIIFVSYSWFLEYHLSPQSLTFVLYIVLVLLLLKIFINISTNQKNTKFFLIFSILLAFTIISHPGTPIFLGLNIIFGLLALRFITPNTKGKTEVKRIFLIFVVLFSIFIIWNIFISETSTLFDSIKFAVERFLRNPFELSSKIIHPSRDYNLVNILRGINSLIEVFFTFIFLFLLYKKFKKNEEIRKKIIIIGAFVVSTFFFLAYSLYSFGYYIERPFMFCLVFFGPLSAIFMSSNNTIKFKFIKILFILALVIVILAIPITRYANEPFEYPPTTTLRSMEYADNNFPNEKVLMSKLGGISQNPNVEVSYIKNYKVVLFDDIGYNYFEIYSESGNDYREAEKLIQDEYNKIHATNYSAIYLNSSLE